MEKRSKMKFLLVMAASDGGLAEEELRFLFDRANEWGFSADEFTKIVDEVTSDDDVELDMPESKEDKTSLLTDLVKIMGADGKLHDMEKQLFANAAARMEMSEDEINGIIDAALKG